jgi:uncharacterized protein (TIGR02594 family)
LTAEYATSPLLIKKVKVMTKWITEAKKHLGLKEVIGKGTNLTIQSWLSNLRAWWRDDETPWCGTFVAHCIKSSGYELPKHWYRAMGWLEWGVDIGNVPCFGCVAILSRAGGGHVFFVLGYDKKGNLVGIGGNQGNSVSYQSFDINRVVGYRMPKNTFNRQAISVIDTTYKISNNEA